jgi:hypothetical protein
MSDVKVLSAPQRLRLFEAVLEFMNRCGVSEAEIRDSFEAALAAIEGPQKGGGSKSRTSLLITTQNLPAQLLRVWHRDARYIDDEAKPRALHLTVGRANLSGAIRRIDPSVDPSQVIRSMKAAGLIRRTSNNRYIPTSETAIVDKLHPLAVEHVTKLVNRLVSTVSRNTDRESGALSLIDRHAYTSDLNPTDRVAFAEFTRERGMAYLESIDDWLEQRRVSRYRGSRAPGKGVAAGVYLFAYLGDGDASSTSRVKKSSSRHVERNVAKKSAISQSKRSSPTREAPA